jgi:hypothetical protein
MRTALLLLAVASLAACQSRMSAVPVVASPESHAALVGEWAGEYESAAAGRSGSIVLTLRAGSDSALGDVVMVPRSATAGSASSNGVHVPPHPQPLAIAFVRASGDSVTGRMQPYESPDCGCRLTTTFIGRLAGDRITGTFVAHGAPGGPQSGTWRVSRKR